MQDDEAIDLPDTDQPEMELAVPDAEKRIILARRMGLVLPMVMIQRRLGRSRRRYERDPTILVIVLAGKADWMPCIASAVRVSAPFDRVSEADGTDKARRAQETDFLMNMARGQRQVFVAVDRRNVPASLLAAADIVLEMGHPTAEDLAEAVRSTVLGRVRDMSAVSPRLDLLDAVSAIRQNGPASAAVARLLALKPRPVQGVAVDDVPGIEELHGFGEATDWAKRLLADLERWRRGELDFAAIEPRRIVLAGAPGLGKTLFARALAKSARLPLRVSSMGTLFATTSGHLDAIVKGIDALFEPHESGEPFVLLLDELEGIPDRANLDRDYAGYWTTVVTHFLTRLDGAAERDTMCIVIGATNYPQRLDEALVRPLRLNRVIEIGSPTEADIVGIMRQHLRGDLSDVDLAPHAALANGASGATIAAWILAARSAAREAGREIVESDLLAQIVPRADHPPPLLERIAVHEAGHAVACHVLEVGIVRALAIAGKSSLGHVAMEAPSRPLPRRQELRDAVVMVLAGRAAEETILGDASGGAGGPIDSDLARATRLVAEMHLSLGLGVDITYRGTDGLLRPDVSLRIDADLKQLYGDAVAVVRRHEATVRRVARALIEEKVLTASRFLEVMNAEAHAMEIPGA